MLFFIYYFYGRFMLRPRLTEVRETFTRGGPCAWIENLLLCFSWSSLNHRVGQKVTKFGIFQTPPANFLLALTFTNAAEYCNSEKKLVKHRWLLYTCARFGELWTTNLWDPRVILLFFFSRNLRTSVYISGMAERRFPKLLHVIDGRR